MNLSRINEILNQEMIIATGCTEPGAVALAASAAKDYLSGKVEKIVVKASGNIIKNAMAAGLPGTPYVGIEYAAAIGAVGGKTEEILRVISDVNPGQYEKAEQLVKSNKVALEVAIVVEKLYIDITVFDNQQNSARAVVSGSHTNIVLIEQNGKIVFEKNSENATGESIPPSDIQKELSVAKIYDFVCSINSLGDVPDMVKKSVEINRNICNIGMEQDFGLMFGKNIKDDIDKKIIGNDLLNYAMMVTCSGADARMAGAPIDVVTNSGSGNQGITCTMPVVAVSDFLEKDDITMYRGVTLSNLMAVYIKSKFGKLSALCGATVAGMSSGCGVVYVLGGQLKEIEYVIHSMIGNVTGMLCDGAKPDCSLKIGTCVNAACHVALLAMKGIRVEETEGIVADCVEQTIENFALIANEGSSKLDNLILQIMTTKNKAEGLTT